MHRQDRAPVPGARLGIVPGRSPLRGDLGGGANGILAEHRQCRESAALFGYSEGGPLGILVSVGFAFALSTVAAAMLLRLDRLTRARLAPA